MSGLYQRALYILHHDDDETHNEVSNGVDFDNESGISIEDQKEIMAQIEKDTVSERRISIDDDILTMKPEKQGVLFPILINTIGAVLTVALIFILQWSFSRQNKQIQLMANTYSGGDSVLINQVKKEAEQRLNAKEKEIGKIQEQLQSLDEEKEKLKDSMDSEIERKQTELEEQMRLELENERKRLQEAGISTENIDEQIEEIQKQKELENKQVLEAFQREAEAQRLEGERRIEELKNEYSESLEDLNSEKASLEKDLADAEQKAKEFEEQQAVLEKEKTEAEKKLKEMAEQREKEERLNQQIRGMYETINMQIQEEQYDTALNSLDEMREFFYDENTAILPGVLERREVELFIIDSLEKLIREERSKEQVDTASLLNKANLISSISTKVNEAESLYQQRDYEGAQELYREALAILPDIEKSYTTLNNIETEQKNRLFSDYLTQAETSYTNLNYKEAIESYKKAIKLFPKNKQRVDAMITRIMEAGYRLQGDTSAIAEDEKNANDLLSKASQASLDGDYKRAIDYYVEILTNYSRTPQVTSARNGIKIAVTREREAITREMEAKIAEKDQMIAEKNAMISEMDKSDIFTRISEKTEQADAWYENMNYEEAKPLYEESLGIIPEMKKSHEKLVFIEDTERNKLFITYFSEAESLYDKKKYEDAIDRYTKAMKLFPRDTSVVDTMVIKIMESGYKLDGDPAVIAEEEEMANELIISASRNLRDKKYDAALDLYIDILTQYPRTSKVLNARNGIKTTIARETETLTAEKDQTINTLESRISEQNNEIARLNTIKEDFTKKIDQLEKDKVNLEAELAALQQQVEEGNTASRSTVGPSPDPTPGPTEAPTIGPTDSPGSEKVLSDDEVIITKKEMEEYNKLKQQVADLKDQYMDYAREEDRIITEKGSIGYLKTKTLLGDLLHSEFATEIFPGLYERLKKFDDALAEDARADGQYLAVDNILNIIYDRMILDSEEEISEYWNGLREMYKDDPIFLELLDEIEDMMED